MSDGPPIVPVVGAAIVRDGRCLVARRGPRMRHPGAWEFPGGKIESGESPETALVRELREELGVEVHVGQQVQTHREPVGAVVVELSVYWCQLRLGVPKAREHDALRWFRADELEDLAWAPADVPIARQIAAELGGPSWRPGARPEAQVD